MGHKRTRTRHRCTCTPMLWLCQFGKSEEGSSYQNEAAAYVVIPGSCVASSAAGLARLTCFRHVETSSSLTMCTRSKARTQLSSDGPFSLTPRHVKVNTGNAWGLLGNRLLMASPRPGFVCSNDGRPGQMGIPPDRGATELVSQRPDQRVAHTPACNHPMSQHLKRIAAPTERQGVGRRR